MSKTLLIIQSFKDRADQVRWSWPYYKLSGWDILGTCPVDAPHDWPEPIMFRNIGENGYISGARLVGKLLETMEYTMTLDAYDDFCIIEYDGLFVRKPPEYAGNFCTKHSVGPMPHVGLLSKLGGYHTPWWFDRPTGQKIVETGRQLMRKGQIEKGSPDMFLGLVMERGKIKHTPVNTFSVNGGGLVGAALHSARQAYRDGVWYIHGFRRKEELDFILKP